MSKWLVMGGAALIVILAVVAIGWFVANARYRAAMAEAEAAWSDIALAPAETPEPFDPRMVDPMPEVARRYFTHAIAPGTPLFRRVELAMDGTFLLGERGAQQGYVMHARQILAPPSSFVWIARMSNGPIRISGSDGLHGSGSWTRFWMFASIPLVNIAATADLDRSAAARPAMEAIWAPASLLPAHGAEWVQTGPDAADVTFDTVHGPLTLSLVIGPDGALQQVWTQRWSNENPSKTYQWQPFGAVSEGEDRFGGFTLPSRLRVGNQFGTPQFLPFFAATVTRARHF